jgi:hypothetical protein
MTIKKPLKAPELFVTVSLAASIWDLPVAPFQESIFGSVGNGCGFPCGDFPLFVCMAANQNPPATTIELASITHTTIS